MRLCRDRCGYYGFGILPSQGMKPAYVTEEFLDRYGDALNQAAALGMKMCLYDEYWFPSGSAGGELAKNISEATAKRLDMIEEDVRGPATLKKPIPPGTLMGIVAMNLATRERIDITRCVLEKTVAGSAGRPRAGRNPFPAASTGPFHTKAERSPGTPRQETGK